MLYSPYKINLFKSLPDMKHMFTSMIFIFLRVFHEGEHDWNIQQWGCRTTRVKYTRLCKNRLVLALVTGDSKKNTTHHLTYTVMTLSGSTKAENVTMAAWPGIIYFLFAWGKTNIFNVQCSLWEEEKKCPKIHDEEWGGGGCGEEQTQKNW